MNGGWHTAFADKSNRRTAAPTVCSWCGEDCGHKKGEACLRWRPISGRCTPFHCRSRACSW